MVVLWMPIVVELCIVKFTNDRCRHMLLKELRYHNLSVHVSSHQALYSHQTLYSHVFVMAVGCTCVWVGVVVCACEV